MRNIKTLPDIIKFCATIGNLPTSYMESLTYEEQLLWLLNFLNKTILPTMHETIDSVEELENWFNNLDVQKEINNKLNEMAESGELEEIISSYLETNALICFNTFNDMKDGNNFVNGSYTKTLGYNNIQDGQGYIYKIRTLTVSDVVDGFNIVALNNYNNLIAERITDIKDEKVVFIGDSYLEGYNPDGEYFNSWGSLIASDMNLDNNHYSLVYNGGAGMDRTLSNNFYSYINENVNKDSLVTKVIVCCGFNDRGRSKTNVINGVSDTIDLIRTKFPNATIYLGMIGSSNIGTNKQVMADVFRYYLEACSNKNIKYLNNVELILHDYNSMFTSDGIHPNQTGQNALATYILNAINSGSADVQYPITEISSTLPYLSMNMNNNIVTIRHNNKEMLDFTTAVVCDGNHYYEIATVQNTYIVGSVFIPTSLMIKKSDGTFRIWNGQIKIDGSKVYVCFYVLTNDNQSFPTVSDLTKVEIPAFTCSVNGSFI